MDDLTGMQPFSKHTYYVPDTGDTAMNRTAISLLRWHFLFSQPALDLTAQKPKGVRQGFTVKKREAV